MKQATQKKHWPNQSAIVVSDAPNMYMILRELLRHYGWQVVNTTTEVSEVVTAIISGDVQLVIVDDSPELPAVSVVRQLISNPFTSGTPYLCFLLEQHVAEKAVLEGLNSPEIMMKPLTPAKFVPKFLNTIKKWETSHYLLLRQGAYELVKSNIDTALKILDVIIASNTEAGHIAAQTKANYLLKIAGDCRAAEGVLLETLKQSRKNTATMLVLADVYMRSAMPSLALRVFQGARMGLSHAMSLLPDIAQAHLMMGDENKARECLSAMYRREYLKELSQNFLARILVSQGAELEAEKIFDVKRGIVEKVVKMWDEGESRKENRKTAS